MNYFYDNMEKTSFDSVVLTCKAVNDEYHITLKETAFYPEKGGMAKDAGTLNGISVIDLYEQGGEVIHVLLEPIAVDSRVHGEVDAVGRLQKCQVHTAQHILSYYLETHYPLMTTSHHVSGNFADIRLEWQIEENSVEIHDTTIIDVETLKRDINQYANEMIRKNLPINICYPDYEEFKDHQKKTNFGAGDEVRVVKLGEEDYNFCGCIHVPSTAYIQVIHVFDIVLTKTGILLQYQAGEPLRIDHENRITIMKEAGIILKQNEYELMAGIDTLLRQKQELEEQLYVSKQRYLDLLFDSLLGQQEGVIVAEYDTLSTKEGQVLASRLTAEHKIVYLLIKQDQNCHVIFASPKGSVYNMKDDYTTFVSNHEFKGGGNAFMAQGGGRYQSTYLDELRAIAQERK